MKFKFTKATAFFTSMLLAGNLFAQTPDSTVNKEYVKPFSHHAFRTWSIGVDGGILTPFTIFGPNSKQDFTSPGGKAGYGGYIKDQILPSFGIQFDFLMGKLQADHSQPNTLGNSPYAAYNTRLQYAASINGNIILANINWHHQKSAIQPYFTFGGGVMGYKPVLTSTDGTVANFKTTNSGQVTEFFVPLGLGLKFDIAKGINLDLGYTVNFVNSDNLDGYDYGSTFDRFSYGHIGLEFALGARSKPQLATYNPVSSMRTEYLNDEQALNNSLMAQQAQINTEKANNDQLRNDLNTTNANLAKFTVDGDGDGVPDFFDKCPNTPASNKVDGSGCPLPAPDVKVYITEEDRKVVKEAINNLEFDFGKATVRDHSFPSLDKVAALLVSKNFSLKLAGHTDNVGADDANMKLSKDRAEAIKAYLVSKGANPSRIEATGYGENQPIASNKTAKGRQANRRVEFTLY
ncbi:MAG: OmpA family protein [Mucilaginibacter sp.]